MELDRNHQLLGIVGAGALVLVVLVVVWFMSGGTGTGDTQNPGTTGGGTDVLTEGEEECLADDAFCIPRSAFDGSTQYVVDADCPGDEVCAATYGVYCEEVSDGICTSEFESGTVEQNDSLSERDCAPGQVCFTP